MSVISAAGVSKPSILFDHKFWDFGSAPVDLKIVHYYKFKNTGSEPLKIIKINPNCDCTSVSAKDTLIPPHDSSEIKIVFHTKEFYGTTTKKATIYTNDPDNPQIDLEYSANIEFFHRLHTSEPKYLVFLQGQNSKDVRLINLSDDDVPYTIMKEPNDMFSLNKYEGEISDKENEIITVTIREGINKGTYFTNFTVIYATKPELRLTIPVKVVRW
jgi:hypothetical protein